MNKLSLEALEKRAKEVINLELLNSISGGTQNACHDGPAEDNDIYEDGFGESQDQHTEM